MGTPVERSDQLIDHSDTAPAAGPVQQAHPPSGPRPTASAAVDGHRPCLSRAHDQRLLTVYRSAGWPCLDSIEIELLASGWLERIRSTGGTEYLRVTDVGIQRLNAVLNRNRSLLDTHNALVAHVAEEQIRQSRIAYTGLALRTKPAEKWLKLRPDVYSIRRTSREECVEPIVHEIKVKRSDLLIDLKKPDKRAGYLAMSSACYYVIAVGIARPDEIPPEFGVMLARPEGLEMVRMAPKRAMKLSFVHWIELAKADRFRTIGDQESLL